MIDKEKIKEIIWSHLWKIPAEPSTDIYDDIVAEIAEDICRVQTKND